MGGWRAGGSGRYGRGPAGRAATMIGATGAHGRWQVGRPGRCDRLSGTSGRLASRDGHERALILPRAPAGSWRSDTMWRVIATGTATVGRRVEGRRGSRRLARPRTGPARAGHPGSRRRSDQQDQTRRTPPPAGGRVPGQLPNDEGCGQARGYVARLRQARRTPPGAPPLGQEDHGLRGSCSWRLPASQTATPQTVRGAP
jgi:hypothetical protein